MERVLTIRKERLEERKKERKQNRWGNWFCMGLAGSGYVCLRYEGLAVEPSYLRGFFS